MSRRAAEPSAEAQAAPRLHSWTSSKTLALDARCSSAAAPGVAEVGLDLAQHLPIWATDLGEQNRCKFPGLGHAPLHGGTLAQMQPVILERPLCGPISAVRPTVAIRPELLFEIGPMKGRCAPDCGRRRNATVAQLDGCAISGGCAPTCEWSNRPNGIIRQRTTEDSEGDPAQSTFNALI